MNSLRRGAAVILLLLLTTGWGTVGHRIINGHVTDLLPSSMSIFIQQSAFLTAHASDADNRKPGTSAESKMPYLARESPRHFIDFEDYPEFASHTIPTSFSVVIAKYDSATVFGIGVNPWAIVWTMDSLTAQMKRGDWSKVWQSAADLGHYVGDAHQPLHATSDYDGRSSVPGSNGIHSRYESNMISTYQNTIQIQPDSLQYVSDPIGFAFQFLYQSNSYVDSIYNADLYARQTSGWNGSGSAPASYYTALWSKVGSWTQLQFQRAVKDYASLLYTAWMNAGSPTVTSVRLLSSTETIPERALLYQNYPNPFNPSTQISFEIAENAHVILSVYTIDGREIAELMDRQLTPGVYRSSFDASKLGLASGLYLYRLQVQSPGRSFALAHKMLFLK